MRSNVIPVLSPEHNEGEPDSHEQDATPSHLENPVALPMACLDAQRRRRDGQSVAGTRLRLRPYSFLLPQRLMASHPAQRLPSRREEVARDECLEATTKTTRPTKAAFAWMKKMRKSASGRQSEGGCGSAAALHRSLVEEEQTRPPMSTSMAP